jgi:hypothetical protein
MKVNKNAVKGMLRVVFTTEREWGKGTSAFQCKIFVYNCLAITLFTNYHKQQSKNLKTVTKGSRGT